MEIIGNQKLISDNRSRSVSCESSPPSASTVNGRYNQRRLSDDVRNLGRSLSCQRFPQVKITPKIADNYEEQQNQPAVSPTIEEGPQTHGRNTLHCGQETTTSKGSVSPVLNLAPRSSRFPSTMIADDRDIVLNYYFNHGFPNATFELPPTVGRQSQPDGRDFTIHEGERFFVNQVLVSGFNHTRPVVIANCRSSRKTP